MSGKFHPIFQWFYFDSIESLPDNLPLPAEEVTLLVRPPSTLSPAGTIHAHATVLMFNPSRKAYLQNGDNVMGDTHGATAVPPPVWPFPGTATCITCTLHGAGRLLQGLCPEVVVVGVAAGRGVEVFRRGARAGEPLRRADRGVWGGHAVAVLRVANKTE